MPNVRHLPAKTSSDAVTKGDFYESQLVETRPLTSIRDAAPVKQSHKESLYANSTVEETHKCTCEAGVMSAPSALASQGQQQRSQPYFLCSLHELYSWV